MFYFYLKMLELKCWKQLVSMSLVLRFQLQNQIPTENLLDYILKPKSMHYQNFSNSTKLRDPIQNTTIVMMNNDNFAEHFQEWK